MLEPVHVSESQAFYGRTLVKWISVIVIRKVVITEVVRRLMK
jgi:hypothetical protein